LFHSTLAACFVRTRINVVNHDSFDGLADGRPFKCQLGSCDAEVVRGNSTAVIQLKWGGAHRATAVLGWEDSEEAERLWGDLVKRHLSLIKKLGVPAADLRSDPPTILPWLGISFAPLFVETAPEEELSIALMTLSEIALAILRPGRRSTLCN
jgi:hypothetical protein